jgi:transposase
MRRGFDGLCRMVREFVGADPLSGDLFVFRSKRGYRVKLLFWLGDGLAIWYRRLEERTFVFPYNHRLVVLPMLRAEWLACAEISNSSPIFG